MAVFAHLVLKTPRFAHTGVVHAHQPHARHRFPEQLEVSATASSCGTSSSQLEQHALSPSCYPPPPHALARAASSSSMRSPVPSAATSCDSSSSQLEQHSLSPTCSPAPPQAPPRAASPSSMRSPPPGASSSGTSSSMLSLPRAPRRQRIRLLGRSVSVNARSRVSKWFETLALHVTQGGGAHLR